jgi:hypothetical protein
MPYRESDVPLQHSLRKIFVVGLLAACFERSPVLAVWLGRATLWAWPGMRRA